jgi:hypothetical protein
MGSGPPTRERKFPAGGISSRPSFLGWGPVAARGRVICGEHGPFRVLQRKTIGTALRAFVAAVLQIGHSPNRNFDSRTSFANLRRFIGNVFAVVS